MRCSFRASKANFEWVSTLADCYCSTEGVKCKKRPKDLLEALEKLKVPVLFGAEADAIRAAVCESLGEDDPICCALSVIDSSQPGTPVEGGLPGGREPISVKYLKQLIDNAKSKKLCKYQEDPEAEPECYSLEKVKTPQSVMFAADETICEVELQESVLATQGEEKAGCGVFTFCPSETYDRTHYRIVGDEDPLAYGILRGFLGLNIDTSTFDLFPFAVPEDVYTCENVEFTEAEDDE